MLYAIVCYNDDKLVSSWTAEQEAAVMQRLGAITQRLAAAGKLGPTARLHSTQQAKVVRKGAGGVGAGVTVTDGPFAETKEHLLGFYLVDVASMDEAVAIAQELQAANEGPSAYDVRPVLLFIPGSLPLEQAAE
jgi:hypothetical protein